MIEVPQPREDKSSRFRLFRFRSPLLTESFRFLFLGLLRCFTSPRVASLDYEFIQRYWPIKASGLSHSEIHGSEPACGFPWLIATCYVLLRLLAPRHPPYALSSLITKFNLSIGSIGTQRQLYFCPIFYLCVVFKEQWKSRTRNFLVLISKNLEQSRWKFLIRDFQMVGLTGLEPVTLRLSSACSNQLSYRPSFEISNLKFQIPDWWS